MAEETRGGHDETAPGRGVTRPTGMAQTPGGKRRAIRMHHERTLWLPWAVVMLGLWLVCTPLTFSHAVGTVEVAGGRPLPFTRETSALLMTVSDVVSGALLVLFGALSLRVERAWARWAACLVGCWLLVAPIVFWAPNATGYVSDTLIGVLTISFTILVPGMPGMMTMMQPGPTSPPGWSYNPSSWAQRLVMAALGMGGFLVSRYLAAVQLGYVKGAWDPFFGAGTERVLTSAMSRSWPISDAGLGAIAYTFETLMAFMGGPARWRTMPWMVAFFGVLVIPLGLTHVALVVSQPVVVGEWCTLCLLAAGLMLPMIPLEVDEVVAMGQFLAASVRAGKPFWRTFWMGGTLPGEGRATGPALTEPPGRVVRAGVRGMSAPWTLAACGAVGAWLMAAPQALGVGIAPPAADSDHLVGAAILVVSVVSMAEVVRAGRWLLAPLGAWLVAAPFLLDGATPASTANGVACGLAVLALCPWRGRITERYGAWRALTR